MKMRNFRRKPLVPLSASVIMILGVAGALTMIGLGWAQEKPFASLGSNEKINIVSNALTVEHESRYAEFSGDVKVTQGDTEIKADKIRIFYKEGMNRDKKSSGEDAIEKIVANGNVKIRIQNNVAVTEEAVYISKTRVIMLAGDNSKVTSGNDSVSGSRITFYIDSNRIMVEGSKEKRVEAIIYPGEKKQ